MKGKRASTPEDDETWKEGEVAPTLNSFDNAGESRATVVAVEGTDPVVAPTLTAYNLDSRSPQSEEAQRIVAAVYAAEQERAAAGGDLPPEGVLAFGRQEDRLAGTVYEDEVPGLTTSKTYAVAVPAEAEGVDIYNQSLTGDKAHTICLATNSTPHALVPPAEAEGVDLLNQTTTGDVSATLRRDGEGASGAVIVPDLAVRRLTPRECERLMGWPDDWTRWAADGSEVADSSRYRMCGNGVASPVAEWIGRCIVAAEQEMGE